MFVNTPIFVNLYSSFFRALCGTLLCVVCLGVTAFARPLIAQEGGGAEVLRGRVLDDDGQPVKGAVVTITGLQSKIERTVKTNDKGGSRSGNTC